MKRTYSIYEAKAKFSRIIRLVREQGAAVTISYHGAPVAEIRPVGPGGASGPDAHLATLVDAGVPSPPPTGRFSLGPMARRRGALRRFLTDRE